MKIAGRKTLIAAATSVFALTGWAHADTPQVSEVEIDTSFLSAEGMNVMDFYPGLADDLEARIRAQVAPSDDPTGPTLRVDVREISLDGETMLPDSMEFNKLEGVMSYSGGEGEAVTVPVSVSAQSGEVAATEGVIVVQPSEADFYNAMMDVFVGAVVDAIPD
ncbi:hypothetical protein R5H30_07005 [Sulfitobacter sp. D35]|uniref:hypothetical protein n=1 Tax=Sulfitobacter sp. D35 TaxID=3083252 RepID=UPI00296FDA9F|nr:hypothetical protein [Sulfitobacter sp. D35]MDW4497722.1 hypothetical protein [Sulfitobacter sp. D35]